MISLPFTGRDLALVEMKAAIKVGNIQQLYFGPDSDYIIVHTDFSCSKLLWSLYQSKIHSIWELDISVE